MPTSQLAGNRARRGRNVRDVTGREYARQHAEQEAKQAAAAVDPAEVRRLAYAAGADAGWDNGWHAALDGVLAMYRAAGIEAVQELMAELDAPDGADGDGDGAE